MKHIGNDLWVTLDYAASLSDHHKPLDALVPYPPIGIFILGLLRWMPFSVAYHCLTLLTLLCYALSVLLLPSRLSKAGGSPHSSTPITTLLLATGLCSYGLYFEIERGQFNMLASALSFLAIYLYHRDKKYIVAAYLLFSLSIQFKLYPAIFGLMLIRDWNRPGRELIRLGLVLGCNALLLGIEGTRVFVSLRHAPGAFIWVGNSSLHAFVALRAARVPALRGYQGAIEGVLVAAVAICILLLLLQAARRYAHGGIDPFLLLACTLGAFLLPPVSHDYKLPLLTAPVAVVLIWTGRYLHNVPSLTRSRSLGIEILGFLLSACYASTLLSYMNKPGILRSNTPILLLLLFCTLLLSTMMNSDIPSLSHDALREGS